MSAIKPCLLLIFLQESLTNGIICSVIHSESSVLCLASVHSTKVLHFERGMLQNTAQKFFPHSVSANSHRPVCQLTISAHVLWPLLNIWKEKAEYRNYPE